MSFYLLTYLLIHSSHKMLVTLWLNIQHLVRLSGEGLTRHIITGHHGDELVASLLTGASVNTARRAGAT